MRRCVKTAAGSLTPDSVRIPKNLVGSCVKKKYQKPLGTQQKGAVASDFPAFA